MVTPVFGTHYNDTTAVTSRNATLPSGGISAGQRGIFIFTVPSGTATVTGGWSLLGPYGSAFPKIYVAYFYSSSGSSGATIAVTTTDACRISGVGIRLDIGDHDTTVAPTVASTQGSSTTPDPPSCSMSGGSKPTLWIPAFAATTTNASATAAPSGYTAGSFGASSAAPKPGLQTAWKESTGSLENPGTFGAMTASSAWSAVTIGVRTTTLVGPTTLLTNAQTFYAPKIKQTVKPSLLTNTQAFYAPEVTFTALGLTVEPPLLTNVQAFYGPSIKFAITAPFHTNAQTFYDARIVRRPTVTARFDNTQAFYAPKIKTTVKLAALFTNTQAFYGPAVAQKIKAPLHTNVQVFYAPTIKSKITAPLHTNVQTFYGPRLNKTVKVTARFDNAQVFYGPSIVFTAIPGFIQPSRHDNAQTFYGPTVIYARTFVAPLHTNTQVFYGPTIKRGVTPSLHTNAQQFFGPRIAFTVKVGARVNNMQNIYPPSLHFAEIRGAPFHTNTQVFYAPTVRRGQKVVAPYFVNDQSFYGPTIIVEKFVEAPFHTNVQEFYGPIRVVVKTPLTVFPGLHVNAQQFFAPRVLFFRPPEPVEPPHGVPTIGAGWWDEALEAYRKRKKKKPLVWNIPSAAEVSDRAPPWNPVVVTRAQAVNRVRQSKAVDAYFRRLDAKRERAKREQQIEDTIINTVVNILKKD